MRRTIITGVFGLAIANCGGEGDQQSASAEAIGSAVDPAPADTVARAGAAIIENDVFWRDTSGEFLYSQGGGVLQVGSTYYWYGVRYGGAATYAKDPHRRKSDTSFVAVTCYSSTDLAHWKFEKNVITQTSIDATGWVGRVGAAYNAKTKQYVLVMQYVGSHGTGELFATSSAPSGDFVFNNVQPTLDNVVNGASGDQSVFVDEDGQAYLVLSSAKGRGHLYVAPLRPSDFLHVEPATEIFRGPGREGNCMYKYGGRYYVNSSDLHGWNSSHTYFISAPNIYGPYSAESILSNTDPDFSHVTQSGLFVTVHGASGSFVIFGGDRWSDFAGNGIGYNEWNPITFSNATPQFHSLTEWSIDVKAGTWAVGPSNNYARNPSFEADRVQVTQPAGWTAVGGSNAAGGQSGRWEWRLTGTSASLVQTVTGVAAGTYSLSVSARSSAQAVAQLFAKNCGGADVATPIPVGAASWTTVTLTGIHLSAGTCQIGGGTTSGANANAEVDVDDFSLVRN